MNLRALAPLAVLLLLGADDKKDTKKDLDLMQGTWNVVSLEVGGNVAPKEGFERLRTTIKGDKMSHQADKEGEMEEVSFAIDSSKNPKTIDLTLNKGPEAGKVILGIYSLEEDTLKLCMNQPSLERPKEFKSEKDTRVALIVLKRAKAK